MQCNVSFKRMIGFIALYNDIFIYYVQFRYTESQRTRSSYEAFAEGLFGTDVYKAQAQPMQNNEITGVRISLFLISVYHL